MVDLANHLFSSFPRIQRKTDPILAALLGFVPFGLGFYFRTRIDWWLPFLLPWPVFLPLGG